jgi:hypothetical protein
MEKAAAMERARSVFIFKLSLFILGWQGVETPRLEVLCRLISVVALDGGRELLRTCVNWETIWKISEGIIVMQSSAPYPKLDSFREEEMTGFKIKFI